ncbi:MAG TPA: PQQ-binding-like beta-propeller repeat protein [Terriglobia bacterium]|nr:PQQ-binding-like beta-propeller repeat protein [Terriglobia bacterium]
MTNKKFVLVFVFVVLMGRCVELAAGDWPTFGHDPQRSGYAFNEAKLNAQNVQHLSLLWKVKVKNEPKSLTALTAPVVADNVETPQGARSVVYVAGSSNNITAIDAATGKILWSREIETRILPKHPGMWLCPNNLNATPTIDARRGLLYVISADGALYGLDLGTGKTKLGPIEFVPPFAKDWSLNLWHGIVYTAASQGCGGTPSGIYSMDIRNPQHPTLRDLIVEHGYGAGIWGRGGVTIGEDGHIYAATGDGSFDPANGDYGSSVIEAKPQSLKVLDYYSPLNYREVTKYDLDMGSSSFVWFAYRHFNLVAGGGKEGVLYLLNAASPGEKDHQTPLYRHRLSNDKREYEQAGIWGGLSEWMDTKGEAWLYVPVWGVASQKAPAFPIAHGADSHGSVMAFCVVIDPATKQPTLKPAWVSRDIDVPEPVAIAGGVVFALSTGENTQQNSGSTLILGHHKMLTDKQRSENTHRAVLYALDAKTGKMLYQSGGDIETWTHFSGLAIASGHVYVVDHDSNLYCFGLAEN